MLSSIKVNSAVADNVSLEMLLTQNSEGLNSHSVWIWQLITIVLV